METVEILTQDSGKVEYYTPPEITQLAKALMGGIDLDPASCTVANKMLGADKIYTKYDDGLSKEWSGKVWLNMPFGKDNGLWIQKLIDSYETGQVTEACTICYQSMAGWYYPLTAYPQAQFMSRVNYFAPFSEGASPTKKDGSISYKPFQRLMREELYRQGGQLMEECNTEPTEPILKYMSPHGLMELAPTEQVLKASVLTYLGPNVQGFYETFKGIARVTVPYQPQI